MDGEKLNDKSYTVTSMKKKNKKKEFWNGGEGKVIYDFWFLAFSDFVGNTEQCELLEKYPYNGEMNRKIITTKSIFVSSNEIVLNCIE